MNGTDRECEAIIHRI